jgi:hypothetical protein
LEYRRRHWLPPSVCDQWWEFWFWSWCNCLIRTQRRLHNGSKLVTTQEDVSSSQLNVVKVSIIVFYMPISMHIMSGAISIYAIVIREYYQQFK